MDTIEMGKRIQKARKAKGWSQEQLAEKVDLSAVYIGMLERGEKTPSLEAFVAIVNALETSADVLLDDVIAKEYKNVFPKYIDRINKLNATERRRLDKMIEAFLNM